MYKVSDFKNYKYALVKEELGYTDNNFLFHGNYGMRPLDELDLTDYIVVNFGVGTHTLVTHSQLQESDIGSALTVHFGNRIVGMHEELSSVIDKEKFFEKYKIKEG